MTHRVVELPTRVINNCAVRNENRSRHSEMYPFNWKSVGKNECEIADIDFEKELIRLKRYNHNSNFIACIEKH